MNRSSIVTAAMTNKGRYRLTREQNRRNEEGGVGDERQDRIGERPISLGRVFPLGSPSS